MTSNLIEKKCVACEGGIGALETNDIASLMGQVEDWEISADGKVLSKTFRFKGFLKTMSFINAMAWMANKEGHHPDFSAGFNYCTVNWSTHAVDGLTENDFICAAKTNALLAE